MKRGLAIASLLGLLACGRSEPGEPYANAFPTREAAAAAVTEAIWQRNVPLLESLAITELEFRRNVWPRLPASRPEVNMPVDYLWGDTRTKSVGGLASTLAEHGGTRLQVLEVSFGGPPTDYGPFTIHPETRLRVRDGAGAERDVRLFGSMIETPDGWKIYSYVVD
jgi:hypothetical protein